MMPQAFAILSLPSMYFLLFIIIIIPLPLFSSSFSPLILDYLFFFTSKLCWIKFCLCLCLYLLLLIIRSQDGKFDKRKDVRSKKLFGVIRFSSFIGGIIGNIAIILIISSVSPSTCTATVVLMDLSLVLCSGILSFSFFLFLLLLLSFFLLLISFSLSPSLSISLPLYPSLFYLLGVLSLRNALKLADSYSNYTTSSRKKISNIRLFLIGSWGVIITLNFVCYPLIHFSFIILLLIIIREY